MTLVALHQPDTAALTGHGAGWGAAEEPHVLLHPSLHTSRRSPRVSKAREAGSARSHQMQKTSSAPVQCEPKCHWTHACKLNKCDLSHCTRHARRQPRATRSVTARTVGATRGRNTHETQVTELLIRNVTAKAHSCLKQCQDSACACGDPFYAQRLEKSPRDPELRMQRVLKPAGLGPPQPVATHGLGPPTATCHRATDPQPVG